MKSPKVKVYVVSQTNVKLPAFKKHIKKFKATRISAVESDEINTLVFHVSIKKISNLWSYLGKKRGIKLAWLGR